MGPAVPGTTQVADTSRNPFYATERDNQDEDSGHVIGGPGCEFHDGARAGHRGDGRDPQAGDSIGDPAGSPQPAASRGYQEGLKGNSGITTQDCGNDDWRELVNGTCGKLRSLRGAKDKQEDFQHSFPEADVNQNDSQLSFPTANDNLCEAYCDGNQKGSQYSFLRADNNHSEVHHDDNQKDFLRSSPEAVFDHDEVNGDDNPRDFHHSSAEVHDGSFLKADDDQKDSQHSFLKANDNHGEVYGDGDQKNSHVYCDVDQKDSRYSCLRADNNHGKAYYDNNQKDFQRSTLKVVFDGDEAYRDDNPEGFKYSSTEVHDGQDVKHYDSRYDSVSHLELFVTDKLESQDKLEEAPGERPFTRASKPLFIEIYAGKGNLSKAMAQIGYDALSVDRPEWDLDQKNQRQKLLSLIKELKPEAVWIAPECRLWSTMQNLNVRTEEQAEILDEERRKHHKAHLSFAGQVFKEQFDGKRVAGIEHPGSSLAWKTKAFKRLPGHRAVLDQCVYGAKLPDVQGEPQPIKKRTRLQVTDQIMAEKLTSSCDGSHDHLNLIGSTPEGGQLTKAAAAYQEDFARALAHELHFAVQRAKSTTSTTTPHLPRSARP